MKDDMEELTKAVEKLFESSVSVTIWWKRRKMCWFPRWRNDDYYSTDVFDTATRLRVLLRFKRNGHTKTLTWASYLATELHKRVEIQNERQFRNALEKFKSSEELRAFSAYK